MTDNICFSGGADGADTAWGEAADRAGHRVVHYTFKNHSGAKNKFAVILDEDQLTVGDHILKAVNDHVLDRSFPAHSDFVTKLLRRNFWQVRDSNAVYAVAGIDGNTVHGGTAWAIECFKMLNPDSQSIFTFDQQQDAWFAWDGMRWVQLKVLPPRPHGKWTGIGHRARGMMPNGYAAIKQLFDE